MVGARSWLDVAESAWGWVMGQVRWDEDGPWVPTSVPGPSDQPDEFPHALHSGIGGLALTLAEVRLTRAWSTTEFELAAGIANAIGTGVRHRLEPSYFAGLAGDVVALRALAPGSEDGAVRRLHEIATPAG